MPHFDIPRLASPRLAGFTLLEVLVVVLILGIATVLSLSVLKPAPQEPQTTAQQMRAMLGQAALNARLSGRNVGWRCDPRQVWIEYEKHTPGQAAEWTRGAEPGDSLVLPAGVSVRRLEAGEAVDCSGRSLFPPFGAMPAQHVEIRAEGRSIRLLGDALGRFAAETDMNGEHASTGNTPATNTSAAASGHLQK